MKHNSIACGQGHTLIVDDKGNLWGFGDNSRAQLGFRDSVIKLDMFNQIDSTVYKPFLINDLKNIISVSCGFSNSLALDNEGFVYHWGEIHNSLSYNSDITQPTKVLGLKNIIHIGSTHQAHFALDSFGKVWSWDKDLKTEGHILKNIDDTKGPFIIEGLENIVSIHAGASHCVFIDNQGFAWGYGSNRYGKLKKSNKNKNLEPFKMKFKEQVVSAACGYEHTLILFSNGEVASLGNNRDGQLGNGLSNNMIIEGLTNVIDISAGHDYSFALRSDGVLFAFGTNDNGQLGNGLQVRKSDESYFYYSYPNEISAIRDVASIVCGRIHTIAKTKDNRYFSWGCSSNGRLGFYSDEFYVNTPHEIIFER